MKAALLTFLLLQVAIAAATEHSAPLVQANGEELLGEWAGATKQIAVFKGIPFARPPFGNLRWRAPQPHQPRVGRPAWSVHSRQDPAVMELGNRIGAMEAFSTELCKMLNPAWR